jgi:phenylacetate-coenzyme A ligase PaaK-like adenylate-forming protein
MLARGLPGLRPQGYRIALFLRSNSNLYEKIGSRWIQFRYFDLMTPLREAVARLNDYRPDIIVAPPSMLGFLADARERGELAHTPMKIISAAEALEPQDRARIEGIFELTLHQIYQCTEGLLAITCRCARLHIQEDLVAMQLEPLPAGTVSPPSGSGKSPGTSVSRISDLRRLESNSSDTFGISRHPASDSLRFTPIITDLWRTTQPIIRYRMNDIVTLDPAPCPCGSQFRVIAEIEGRCDDILYFCAESGSLLPIFPDTIRRMVLLASDAILDYQAIQTEPGSLTVHMQTSLGQFDAAAASVNATVQKTVAQYGCRPVILTVEHGLPAHPANAKRRRVRREYSAQ